MPSWRASALSWLPMGHLIKVVATYKRPFWRENGFSGAVSVCVCACVRVCVFGGEDSTELVCDS